MGQVTGPKKSEHRSPLKKEALSLPSWLELVQTDCSRGPQMTCKKSADNLTVILVLHGGQKMEEELRNEKTWDH